MRQVVVAGSEVRCGKPEEVGGPVPRGRRAGGWSETPECRDPRGHLSRGGRSTWEEGPGDRFHRLLEGSLRGLNPREAPARESANHRFEGDEPLWWSKAQESSGPGAAAAPAARGLVPQRQVGKGRREAVRLPRTGEASKGEAQERSSSEIRRGRTAEKEGVRRDEETLETQRSGVRQTPCEWAGGVPSVVGQGTPWEWSTTERMSARSARETPKRGVSSREDGFGI